MRQMSVRPEKSKEAGETEGASETARTRIQGNRRGVGTVGPEVCRIKKSKIQEIPINSTNYERSRVQC
jgi:hypothetical protein